MYFRIHRFCDQVCLHTSHTHADRRTEWATCYMSADTALTLAATLVRFANDVDRIKFTESTLSTEEYQE